MRPWMTRCVSMGLAAALWWLAPPAFAQEDLTGPGDLATDEAVGGEEDGLGGAAAPQVVSRAEADEALSAALAPVPKDRGLRRAAPGVALVRVSDGAEVFGHRSDRLLVPASAAKVVTAAAALRTLGPSYAFTTDVLHDGTLRDGVLQGNLYIRGGGDPTLVAEKLWRLLLDVKHDGVLQVQGDVIFDDTRFTDDPQIPGWDKPVDIEKGPSYFPSIGALGLDFGVVVLVVRPGGEFGKAASLQLGSPAGRAITLVNELATGPAGSPARVEIEREVREGGVSFTVSGSVPAGGDVLRFRRAVPDPTALFIGVTDDLLTSHGVRVSGRLRRGPVADDAVLLRRMYSPPLSAVLMDMNKYSSNFIAEMVLRSLGAEGGDGSNAGGLAVVRSVLRELGVADEDALLVNGSGLSRKSMMTPAALTRVLQVMAEDPAVGPEFVASLSIAGSDGTLIRRLRDLPGRVRGKTGTLDGVHTLAGYVRGADAALYAFAFLVNDVPGNLGVVKQAHDDFLRRVAGHGGAAP